MFEKIQKWYKQGLWSRGMVENAVKKGHITLEQYREITGEPYPEEQEAP